LGTPGYRYYSAGPFPDIGTGIWEGLRDSEYPTPNTSQTIAPMALDYAVSTYYHGDMRTAEVAVNKKLTVMVNDREHKAFKLKCVNENRDMSEVVRELIREYVSKKK
jgi:hypothetical protein